MIMVHVDVTYMRTRSNVRDNGRKTLMIGKWNTHETRADDANQRVSIDCDRSTPTKAKISVQNRYDSTPSTTPTSLTPTKINFDSRGRPEHIEIYHIPDDCSVSTMGDSVFDDAKPGRSSVLTAKPSIILCGTF